MDDGTAVELAQQTEVESLKSSVSEGKSLIAAAVTDKGVPTAADDAFQVMAENIQKIQSSDGLYLYNTFTALGVPGEYASRIILYASDLFNMENVEYIAAAIWGDDTRYYGVVSCWNTNSGKQSLVGSSLMSNINTSYYKDRIEIYATGWSFNVGGFVVAKALTYYLAEFARLGLLAQTLLGYIMEPVIRAQSRLHNSLK